jgi:uncharacterized protein YbgA (DUF1722 family)/uncharacterized protein YbbK (DUF523 family)
MSQPRTVRLGVSACLLGEQVRFDGGHKRNAFLAESLNRFVEWVKVCPEHEAGFGTPREAMRLVRAADSEVRLTTVRSHCDLTAELRAYSVTRAGALAAGDLDGFVLKKDSPTCGLTRVKVYDPNGVPTRSGRGLFAQALCTRLPLLPVEEEGRLHDPAIREHFIERVFAYRRLRRLLVPRVRVSELVQFHTTHKLQLLAHSPTVYADLGRMVARARDAAAAALACEYADTFMAALAVAATRGRHSNVLQHMAGYLRERLSREARHDLASAITEYQHALVPLVTPLRLLAHYTTVHQVRYLAEQVYLDPYPKELMVRNHA